MSYSYENARKNAKKVADAVFNLHIQPGALDDGEWWIFPWKEDMDPPFICVHQKIGGICMYDPESHPKFKDAVMID